jgi:plasmid stabilization system protein ParE
VKHYRFHREADAEFTGALSSYVEISPALGARFYDEIERLITELCQHPMRFREFDPPARRNLAKDFPYTLIYLDEPDYVWILAVMHLHREPGYWKHRLTS